MPDSDKSLFVRIELFEKTLESVTNNFERRIVALEDSKNTLERIATITEMHIKEIQKRDERQDIREEKQDLTLMKISETLTEMTNSLKELHAGQHSLNKGQDELEKRMDLYEERGKIDVWKTVSRISWLLVTGIISGFLGYVLTKTGLK